MNKQELIAEFDKIIPPPKCPTCKCKLKGEPQEYKGCCCYACWKKWRAKNNLKNL